MPWLKPTTKHKTNYFVLCSSSTHIHRVFFYTRNERQRNTHTHSQRTRLPSNTRTRTKHNTFCVARPRLLSRVSTPPIPIPLRYNRLSAPNQSGQLCRLAHMKHKKQAASVYPRYHAPYLALLSCGSPRQPRSFLKKGRHNTRQRPRRACTKTTVLIIYSTSN